MPTPGVGQDIEAMCGRCGQVWHVVMAKMGDKIAKVVCKRCGGHHRYRDENAAAAADSGGGDAAGRARRPTFGSSRRTNRSARPSAPEAPAFDPAKPPRAYAARDSYVAGERVAHPTFGVGVIAGSPGAGKVDVVFSGGVARVLACAKVSSTLARPVATQDLPLPDRPPK